MKNRHLFSLLDTSYTTIGVRFQNQSYPAPPPMSRDSEGSLRTKHAPSSQHDSFTDGYTYKVPKDWDVREGNLVVVESGLTGALELASVVRVDLTPNIDVDADFDYKWVVQLVDLADYSVRVQKEADFNKSMLEVERVKQRESLLDSFRNSLPEGSAARELFEATTATLPAATPAPMPVPDVPPAPPAAPEAPK